MAEIHSGTTLHPTKLELLTEWMASQRWYAAKGSTPNLARLASWRLGDPAGEVGIETHIVLDSSGNSGVTYQVPLTYRGAPVAELAHALVGTMEHGVLGTRWVYDGTHDPVYARQLLALIRGDAAAESSTVTDAPDPRFGGEHAASWTTRLTFQSSRVLVGEQSNTSIIVTAADDEGRSTPVIVKVFRQLAAGENPDVVLQSALRESGCERVPAVVGAVAGSWPLSEGGTGANGGHSDGNGNSGTDVSNSGTEDSTDLTAHGHLAFAQEFIPGTEDAWRVALRAAKSGTDFATAARDLGEATAAVHTVLSAALPTAEASDADLARVTSTMRRRLSAASGLVTQIAERAQEIEAVFAAAEAGPWPALQRIHGDYHLGQVLHSQERGWLLLDFEGEPLRPLAERSLPDSTFRDVAGMLRSFDYAGGSAEHGDPDTDARAWVESASQAFLDGYAKQAPDARDHDALLRAFLLDKALYEVVYEARNRPTWLAIPVAAITRLLGESPASTPQTSTPPTPETQTPKTQRGQSS